MRHLLQEPKSFFIRYTNIYERKESGFFFSLELVSLSSFVTEIYMNEKKVAFSFPRNWIFYNDFKRILQGGASLENF